MNPQILFRPSLAEEGEHKIAKEFFGSNVYVDRSRCYNAVVIARYSCLPYYEEYVHDLENRFCRPINSIAQHKWIADHEYYEDLSQYMPKCWTDDNIYLAEKDQQFIVKGKTNCRKNWKYMYGKDRKEALQIAAELAQDGLIGPQGIVYKEYVELESFDRDITGIPVANEWRFFYVFDRLLCYGYYWSNFPELQPVIDPELIKFAQTIADLIHKQRFANFYVLDIAKKKDGSPILIEINDGQMSGLSNCDAKTLYRNLKNEIKDLGRIYI